MRSGRWGASLANVQMMRPRVHHLPAVMQRDIGIDPHIAARFSILAAKGGILTPRGFQSDRQ